MPRRPRWHAQVVHGVGPVDAAGADGGTGRDQDPGEREGGVREARRLGGALRLALDDLQGGFGGAPLAVELGVVDPQDHQVDAGVGGVAVVEAHVGVVGEDDRVGPGPALALDHGPARYDGGPHARGLAVHVEPGHQVGAVLGAGDHPAGAGQGAGRGHRPERGEAGVGAGLAGFGLGAVDQPGAAYGHGVLLKQDGWGGRGGPERVRAPHRFDGGPEGAHQWASRHRTDGGRRGPGRGIVSLAANASSARSRQAKRLRRRREGRGGGR